MHTHDVPWNADDLPLDARPGLFEDLKPSTQINIILSLLLLLSILLYALYKLKRKIKRGEMKKVDNVENQPLNQ